MASKGPPKKPAPPVRRRRPPPTIDLSATEVRVEPPRAATPSEPEPEMTQSAETPPPTPEPVVEHSPSPAFPDIAPEPLDAAPEHPTERTPPPEPAAAAPPEPDHLRWQRPPPDSPPEPPSSPSPPPRSPWPMLGAAAGGAAALLLALYAFGLLGGRDVDSAQSTQLAQRLAALEAQATRRADQPSIDPKALDDIAARIARVETAANTPRTAASDPALANRLSSIEVAVKSLGDVAASLNTRGEDVSAALRAARERADATAKALAEMQATVAQQRSGAADKSETDKLAARIAALESSTRTVEQKIETPGSTAADRDVRMAVLASALKDAVERGALYMAELNAIKPLVNDQPSIAALEKFSTTGAPTSAALTAELNALLPSLMQAAAPQTRDGSLLDRLQANANRLVRIRPADEPAGDDPATIVERVEAKAQRSDVAGALTELARLPANVRSGADAWIAKAQARSAALGAAHKIAGDSYGALARPAH